MQGLWELKRDIAQIGLDYAIARRTIAAMRYLAVVRYAAKFDPAQPRDQRGRWTESSEAHSDSLTFEEKPNNLPPAPDTYQLAARGRQSDAYCWNQLTIDLLYCGTLPRSIYGACRGQAMERYSACLVGKPLPPLLF